LLDVSWLAWTVTVAFVVVLLSIDFVTAARRPHEVGFREAVAWSVFYIVVALIFAVVFASFAGWDFGVQYLAGYLVEKSLSIDNLFVFVIIMTTFAVPAAHQHKVLTFGIAIALLLRAVFIAIGATLLELFSVMFLLFGLLLLFTAVQLYRHRNEDPDVEDNALVRLARRWLPVTDDYRGGNFTLRVNGARAVTPLFVVLIAIGSTDILFALDSIPAVFGVTKEPYIVFTANAFALLGLRALFFLVTGLLDRLVYLSTGLAVVLGLIGVKLVLHWGHTVNGKVPELSTPVSLAVVAAILTVTTIASLAKVRRDPTATAHAGALRAGSAAPAPPSDLESSLVDPPTS
jgi:tellurite resistance protein TerC